MYGAVAEVCEFLPFCLPSDDGLIHCIVSAVLLIIYMGAETSVGDNEELLEKLQFVQVLEDDNFGAVEVFRSR